MNAQFAKNRKRERCHIFLQIIFILSLGLLLGAVFTVLVYRFQTPETQEQIISDDFKVCEGEKAGERRRYLEMIDKLNQRQETLIKERRSCESSKRIEIAAFKEELEECQNQTQVQERGPCEDGWSHLKNTNKCYRAFHVAGEIRQMEAKTSCEAQDSTLTSIQDDIENVFVYSLGLQNTKITKIWIGNEYNANLEKRIWLDGNIMEFTKYGVRDESTDANRTVTVMCIRCGNPAANRLWYTDPDESNPAMEWNGYVCKKNSRN